jgi:MFS superfamily sulfate permease-like transporter
MPDSPVGSYINICFTEEVISLARNTNSLKWFCISAANISDVDFTASDTLKNVSTHCLFGLATLELSNYSQPTQNHEEPKLFVENISLSQSRML